MAISNVQPAFTQGVAISTGATSASATTDDVVEQGQTTAQSCAYNAQSNSQIENCENYGDSDVGDYVADESKAREVNAAFNKGFTDVHNSAKLASQHMLAGNKFFYKHLAKFTAWYHCVEGTKYLKELVKEKTQKEYRDKVNHGINFAPIIDAVWFGIDRTDLPVNKTNRISRALNRLYEAYGEKFAFAPDAEDALVQYIVNMGGVSGLVTYGNNKVKPEDVPDLIEDKKINAKAAALVRVGVEKAQKASVDFFKAKTNLNAASFANDIDVNKDDMALVLVKKDGQTSYSVIDTIIDNDQVTNAAAKTYLGQYNALPPAIRFIVETVATQVCPVEQGGTYGQLLNEANKHMTADGKKSVRRLAYKHQEGTFLLSNIRSRMGLVTVATPKLTILDGAIDDVAMTIPSRRMLETYLIGPKNFCLLDFAKDIGAGPIPQSDSSDFTHGTNIGVLTEKTKNDNTKVPILFGRESLNQQPFDQVDVIDDGNKKPIWERSVSASWFKTFNAAFTHNWVNSHARHVNRPHQSVLEVLFRQSSLLVKFFNIDNEADLSSMIPLPAGSSTDGYRCRYLSKDIAVAMLQLGELPLIGQATLSVYQNYLRISYETEVGNYSIYLPAVNSTGEQIEGGFGQYTLQSIIPEDDLIEAEFGDECNGNDGEGEL